MHEPIDDVPKVAPLGEDAVYEVDAQHAQGLLLRLRCAVQHARVQHHRVGRAPALACMSVAPFKAGCKVVYTCSAEALHLIAC